MRSYRGIFEQSSIETEKGSRFFSRCASGIFTKSRSKQRRNVKRAYTRKQEEDERESGLRSVAYSRDLDCRVSFVLASSFIDGPASLRRSLFSRAACFLIFGVIALKLKQRRITVARHCFSHEFCSVVSSRYRRTSSIFDSQRN